MGKHEPTPQRPLRRLWILDIGHDMNSLLEDEGGPLLSYQ